MRILIPLLVLTVFACSGKQNKPSYPIIPEDKFVKILVQYHLSEGIGNARYYYDKIRDVKELNLQDSALKQYGYTKAIFDSTVSYYTTQPEKFDAIYEKAITELSIMLAQIQAQEKAEREKNKPVQKKDTITAKTKMKLVEKK